MRVKKPLKELLQKIMVEIRKKDDYALFEEPVDLEAFPDYLDVIGGEDNMMDMGTMQAKVDRNEYRNIEQIEADLRTLASAAQKFNPPGSVPHKSAGIILAHGLKHIERSRPLVLTPPSSPRDSATPARATSVLSTRELTAALEERKARDDVPPHLYIPEEMLSFPPNSVMARAVGWNLNGGKRMYNKRISRAREKFGGKWRNWTTDGSRDIAEADDIHLLFDPWRVRTGEEWRKVPDWQALRNETNWWELEMPPPPPQSAAQQAPLPFNPGEPRLDKVPLHDFVPYDFGQYPSISSEISFLRQRIPNLSEEEDILSEHIRPVYPRLKKGESAPPPNLVNIYDGPLRRTAGDWVREMATGGVIGEAYIDSLNRFVKGAMKEGAEKDLSGEQDTKPNLGSEQLPLDEYVMTSYHTPFLQTSTRQTIHDTLGHLSPLSARPDYILPLAKAAYARVALRLLTGPSNPMDIKPLLREEGDFMYQGVGGKSGVNVGLEWTGEELRRLVEKMSVQKQYLAGKRKREEGNGVEGETKRIKMEADSAAAITDKPSLISESVTSHPPQPRDAAVSEEPEKINDEELKRLRLELVALSKFYPLPALKKMSKEEAAKLLPVNVRDRKSVV